jgi:hypothetical protein
MRYEALFAVASGRRVISSEYRSRNVQYKAIWMDLQEPAFAKGYTLLFHMHVNTPCTEQ